MPAGDPWCKQHGQQLCRCAQRSQTVGTFETKEDFHRTGRILTLDECDWLSSRGLHQGFDVDTCDPQLNHVVVMDNPDPECLCGASTLWFHGPGWFNKRGDGSHVEEDRRLRCESCLLKLDSLRSSEMGTLTNAAIDEMWDEAKAKGDTKVLALIEEIDDLKAAMASVVKKRLANKTIYVSSLNRSRKKSFHRGQSYMRGKIADALARTGHPELVDVALTTHVDYNIEPVGRFTAPDV